MRRTWIALLTALVMCLTGWAGTSAGAGSIVPRLPNVMPTYGPAPKPAPKPQSRPRRPPPPPVAAPRDRWALIVGVTAYRGRVRDTVGGARDARLVRDVLLRSGWRKDRIRILTDGQATGRNVANGLSWLQRNSSRKTFSMFHYSGHVKQRNGREYLWPVDNRYLRDADVARVLKAIRGTAWTSIAGCEAAGFHEGLSSSRHLFTGSSKRSEKSYEDRRTGYSVWAGMMFDQGLRRVRGDRNGDRRVSVQEAFAYAAPRAHTYTKRQRPYGPQTPQRYGGNGHLYLTAPRI